MGKFLHIQKGVLIIGSLLIIFSAMVLIANSPYFDKHTNLLSLGITVDLILTAPLVYFLFIRKTSIPKTTVIPLVLLGTFFCSLILPAKNQYYLEVFKTWGLPLIELSVLVLVTHKLIKTRKAFLKEETETFDFFTNLKSACAEILPKSLVIPMATEIGVFYYGFLNWKNVKLKANEFTYHKESGTIALLFGIILIVSAETIGLHYLLMKWNAVVAWIFTGLSVYSGIQIFGFLRSMTKRPILIENNKLFLRYGIMNETIIDINEIDSVEVTSRDIELNEGLRKLSFLGELESHNVIIHLKKENTIMGLYGIKRSYKSIACFIDHKETFKLYVENVQGVLKQTEKNPNK